MNTSKPKFADTPQTLVYDLSVENDPLVRQGIHGLYRLLFHGVGDNQNPDPNYRNSFPCLPDHFEPGSPQGVTVVKGAGWTARMTDSTLTLEGVPKDLYPLFFGQVGTMTYNGKTGIYRAPGYRWEDPDLLEKMHFCNMGGGPFNPATRAQIRLTKGSLGKQDFLLSLNDLPRAANRLESNTTASWPLAVPPPQEFKGIETGKKDKPSNAYLDTVDASKKAFAGLQSWKDTVSGNTGVHPVLNKWNNIEPQLSFRAAFILLFARLSFVWTTAKIKDGDKKKNTKPETASVGLAIIPDTFSEADQYHENYQGTRHDGLRPVLRVYGNPEFVSWVLASAIDYPTSGRNVLHKIENPEFHVMGHQDPDKMDPWGVRFRGLIQEGLQTAKDFGEFRGLRFADKSVYPQVLTNLSNGWTWCRGLDESLFQAEKDYDGRVLNNLVEAMVFEPKDQLIVDQTRKFRGALYNHFRDKGYGKEGEEDKASEKAEEVMILRGLRNVKTASELLNTISRWGEMTGWVPYTDDVLSDIMERAHQDTLGIRALLSVSVHSWGPEKATEGNPDPAGSSAG